MSYRCIDFNKFNTLVKFKTEKAVTLSLSKKKVSPNRQYFFKRYIKKNISSNEEKIFIDTFNKLNLLNNQYLLGYSHYATVYNNQICFVLSNKFVSSKTLKDELKDPNFGQKYNIKDILHCIFGVANAMCYLHNNLIYHGNLCPSNILIDDANQFYVCDPFLYPIKKIFMNEDELFEPNYKDPSMVNNMPTMKNDIYSFGVLLVELFLGFFGKNENDTNFVKDFLDNPDKNKFDKFPVFITRLIKKCLDQSKNEKITFNQIIKEFINSDTELFGTNVQKEYNKFVGIKYCLELAKKDRDGFILNDVGKMYENGKGVEIDLQKALEYYKRGSSMRNAKCLSNYAILLKKMHGEDQNALREAAEYLEKSAERGNVKGMANYGQVLLKGDGVEKDIKKAKGYLKKAAEQGNPIGNVYYMMALLKSRSTKVEIGDGLTYLGNEMHKANPDSESFFIYAYLLAKGIFVEKNEEFAIDRIKYAAFLGNENAKKVLQNGELKFDENFEKEIYSGSEEEEEEEEEEEVETEEDASNDLNMNNIEFPLQITEKSCLISPGVVVYDRGKYHNQDFIYPPGYKYVREFLSIENPTKSGRYLSSIIDNGDTPLFRVDYLNNGTYFVDINPSRVWKKIVQEVENAKKIHGIKNRKNPTISGPEYFGFNNITIRKIIEDLPNAEKCVSYNFRYIKMQRNNEEQINESSQNAENLMLQSPKQLINDSPSTPPKTLRSPLTTEELVQKCEEFSNNSDTENVYKCLKEIERRGEKEYYHVIVKYADNCPTDEEMLRFYELTIKENVPRALTKWHHKIGLMAGSQKYKDNLPDLAMHFVKFNYFWEAADLFKKGNDDLNFQKYYTKAKENIDDIKDGNQQMKFGSFLLNQKDYELAKVMFEKALANNISEAEKKIKKIEQIINENEKSQAQLMQLPLPQIGMIGGQTIERTEQNMNLAATSKNGSSQISSENVSPSRNTKSQVFINTSASTNDELFIDQNSKETSPTRKNKKITDKDSENTSPSRKSKSKSDQSSKSNEKLPQETPNSGGESLPITIGPKAVILNFGTLVTDRPNFNQRGYIYPVGFKSRRQYKSVIDPSKETFYTSEIIDTGKKSPLFRVTMEGDEPMVFEGDTPTNPWNQIQDKIREIEESKTEVSGPKMFGLELKKVRQIIQNLPGASAVQTQKKIMKKRIKKRKE